MRRDGNSWAFARRKTGSPGDALHTAAKTRISALSQKSLSVAVQASGSHRNIQVHSAAVCVGRWAASAGSL